MMKKTFSFLLTGILAISSMVGAQGASSQEGDADEGSNAPVYPTTGVRFVACNPSNVKLPPTLYAAYKDNYLPISISSRGPSERVQPNAQGHVLLYKDMPQEGEKPGDPYLDITLPREVQQGKVICIMLFTEGKTEPRQLYYIRESELPVGGFYVFNFSPVAVEMVIITEPKQIPKQGDMISAYKKTKNNCISPTDSNVWSLMSKDKPDLDTFAYVLRVPAPTEGGTPMLLRGSRYALRKNLSHVTIIVRHPTLPQAFRLVSFSYNAEPDKRNKARSDAKQAPVPGGRQPRRSNPTPIR